MIKASARYGIIEKTIGFVIENGISDLSFDRLVGVTGISKGGILYHFPTKEALLVALIKHVEQAFLEQYTAALENTQPHPGRVLLAYLKVSLGGEFDPRMYTVLVSITAERPDLLSQQATLYQVLRQDIKADGGNFARQWTLVAALDGLWMDHTCHLYNFGEAEHAEFARFLLNEARAIVAENK